MTLEKINQQYSEKSGEPEKMLEDFTWIYTTYYKRVYKYICYRISDEHMAEEICSHVFEKILTNYHTASENKMSFEAWIFAIARNTVTDYYRAQKKNSYFSLDTIFNKASTKPSPDECIISAEENSYLFQALNRLKDKERGIISLKYGAELKNTEIAKLMDISESNVGVILYRSLKKLEKILVAGGFKYE
jgi:RNA polymerase sigma-70 factor (ECF subfamily)